MKIIKVLDTGLISETIKRPGEKYDHVTVYTQEEWFKKQEQDLFWERMKYKFKLKSWN